MGYDEDQHPRGDHGRWTSGGDDAARVEHARSETAETARVQGKDPQAAGEAAAVHERAAIANEHAARAAGHLHDVPHEKLDSYAAARETAQRSVADIRSKLDEHHAAAAQALADLHAHDSGDQLEHTHSLVDHMESTSGKLAELSGHEATPDFTSGATHESTFGDHAERTQTALEGLHAAQTEAAGALRGADRAHGQAARAARSEAEIDAEDLVNHDAIGGSGEHTQRARDAAESSLSYESARREELTSGMSFEDAHNALTEETRQTARSIKELSKITGRAPRLAGGKAKKSANRPDSAPGASVWGMPAPARYKLRLTKLDFLSLVDVPAQETAAIRLVKRKDGAREMDATLHARVVKWTDGDNPLVYCWAFTCTDESGRPYHDLQGDAITPDFIKAAEAFMAAGGAVDEMHDSEQKSRIAFAYPMDPDIAKAMLGEAAGAAVKQSGLMVAIRPTAEQLAKIKSGDYTGVSIAGTGIRELVKAAAQPKCPSCGTYGKADDKDCASCGKAMAQKGVWSTADVDSLPDSSFLYIEGGGSKDSDGKTTPRSLRHFPYRDASGSVDLPHLRDAIGRIPQSSLPKDVRDKLQIRAEKLLAAQHDKAAKRVAKADQGGESTVVATSEVDGHQHTLDLDDPADGWQDQLSTSYATAEGATNSHSHGWVFDPATGAVTILADSGHTHTSPAVVPPDVIRQCQLNDSGERCPGCGEMCEEGCRFCPKCGCAMDRSDGVPDAPMSDDDSESGSAPVIVIAARAPGISPPVQPTPTVKADKEPTEMADNDRIKTLEAENAQLKKMASLNDAHRAHIAKLNEQDAVNFLNLTVAQRDTVLAEIEKADEVVYESPRTGRKYRKSVALEILEAARTADASAAALEQLNIAKRDHEFTKRGETVLKNWPRGAKGDLRGRIMKAIDGEFKDPAEHEEAVKALKGSDAAFDMLTKAHGVSARGETDGAATPGQAFEVAVQDFAKRNNVTYAVALERGTATDPEIRRLYNEAQLAAH